MVCKRCGGTCENTDVFCPFCGSRLAEQSAPPAAEAEKRTALPADPEELGSYPARRIPQQAPAAGPSRSVPPAQRPEDRERYQHPAGRAPETAVPSEYKPISAWGYVGYNFLFAIPLIGFILLLVYAFGGTPSINLRNYARSFFCALLIVLLLIAAAVALMLAFGFSPETLEQLRYL